MSREWVDDRKKKPTDKRWVMRCDVGLFDSTRGRCPVTSEPSFRQPPLWHFVMDGWFVAKVHGDVCPSCLAEGFAPKTEPHEWTRRMAA